MRNVERTVHYNDPVIMVRGGHTPRRTYDDVGVGDIILLYWRKIPHRCIAAKLGGPTKNEELKKSGHYKWIFERVR